MPTDKSSLLRFLLIDKRLRTEPHPTLEQLKVFITEQFKEITDEKTMVSRLSIKKDIKDMRKLFLTPIEFSFEKNQYHYQSPSYTFLMLPDSFVERLIGTIQIQYLLGAKFNDEKKIRFETKVGTTGWEHVPLIVRALNKKKVLNFVYKSHNSKRVREYHLHPYLLEENSNRWVLFGRRAKGKNIQAFELSRIIGAPVITSKEAVIDNTFYSDKHLNPKNENQFQNE
jgi:predicted DNA-binding transcriptional regulator YafY